ncbi:hypothetical protein LBMAG37_12570 [Anaerolineae bacterium]|nr:hypothetical protein LBMAG37_12570 [Anaerolineae bacterium]
MLMTAAQPDAAGRAQFLESLAAGTAAPAGGSAAAYSVAMAAALLAMVARLTIGRKKYASVAAQMQAALEQAEALCRRASSAVAEDVVAFEAVMAALRQPAANAAESAARSAALSAATLRAAEVQLDVARTAAGIVQLAQICATHGNINAAPDAAAAAHLALGGLCAAVLNVRSNCASLPDKEQASALAAAATQVETAAHAGLQATLQAVATRAGRA